ncbi:hypothetical protein PU629_16380 [Pullulanibacillus sp. KACC 23026]|uniref:hypothetical protein n=1 Tax=Pullulanibacillus sp. KACC 23026 TaxID=3028315 RepID=UPI0023B0948D|nr:hypothetical protein [Pullulanibacillus sp. KACC 23026]WEG11709.1 hypothetical protein PU629_16380 [Pullulanibacillus sp. KACC 23026]
MSEDPLGKTINQFPRKLEAVPAESEVIFALKSCVLIVSYPQVQIIKIPGKKKTWRITNVLEKADSLTKGNLPF